jgi:hypothetical protein
VAAADELTLQGHLGLLNDGGRATDLVQGPWVNLAQRVERARRQRGKRAAGPPVPPL